MRGRTKILICFWFICCFWCGLFVSLYGGVPWTQKPRSYLYPAGNQSYQGFPLLSTHVKRLGMSDVPSSLDLRTVFGSRFLSHHLLFYLVLYTYKYHVCTLSSCQVFSRSSIRSLGSGNTYKYHVCTLSSCPNVQSFIYPFIGPRKHLQVPVWTLSLSLELPKCTVVHPSVHWVQETRTSTMSALSRAAQMFSRSSIRSLGSGNTYKYHVCTLSSCPNVQSFIYPFIGPRKHFQVPVCTLSLSSCPNVQSFIHPFIGFRKYVQVPCLHSLELPKCSVVHLSVHWVQETHTRRAHTLL